MIIVLIRVDGNSRIGLGHIYRGLALAEILKGKYLIEFITRIDTIVSPLQESGFNYSFIPDIVKFVDEPNWIKDNYSKETIIVLDGYEFNQKYQQKIKDLNFKLVYIDDLARGVQKADLVINHSPGVKAGDYKTAAYTKLALGLNYALLRKSFIEFNRKKAKQNSKIKNIFISFGGADKHDFSLMATQEVLKLDFVQSINVVLGAAYKNKIIFDLKSSKLKIHQNLSEHEVFKLMNKSDLAIVPASTTSIELASLGVPMILGYFVENQQRIYNGFLDKEAVCGIGDFRGYKFSNIKQEIINCDEVKILKRIQNNLKIMFCDTTKSKIINLFKILC